MNKRLFSGIQPSGNLHIGNYLGAIKQWIPLQDEYEAFFSIVDFHAITVPQDPEELRRKTLEVAKIYLAAGIEPSKATLFVQSHVPEHAELMWVLNTITKNGDLTKMTQFKDKSGVDADEFENALRSMIESDASFEILEAAKKMPSEKVKDIAKAAAFETADHFFRKFKSGFNSVAIGLFDYPVLMTADILLYDTAVVPVGEDQVQHIELARTLARRFNDRFGSLHRGDSEARETFVVPESRVMEEGARVMGLDDPTKKMSKSAASEYNYIALNDDPEKAKKKIMKAVTDSGTEIAYGNDKPAFKNLINIYSLLGGKSTEEIVLMYRGRGYSDFKRDLADVVAGFLADFQSKLSGISDEDALQILHDGADKARAIASAKMKEVKEKVGFLS